MTVSLDQAAWRKSSYSGGAQDCVEIAGNLPGAVAVRDSKNPDGPALIITPRTWQAFLSQARNGKLDLAAALVPAPRRAPMAGALRTEPAKRTNRDAAGRFR
jgi:hypothetical protein